jgi:hypothetical protein
MTAPHSPSNNNDDDRSADPDMAGMDEPRLRRALAMIATEAGHQPRPRFEPRRPWWRRHTPLAAAAAGLAAAVAIAGGILVSSHTDQTSQAGDGPSRATGDRSLSGQENIACSRLMFVGDVTSVRAVPGQHRVTVTARVSEWVKPASGPEAITFQVENNTVGNAIPEEEPGQRPWKAGAHGYILVPLAHREPAAVVNGKLAEDTIARDRKDLPKAAGLRCPQWWLDSWS